ncbi:ATP-binding cassette domain-containing protein [Streptantibioticus silvisoli]|uniref:ATP-binding cassette domain-containing protein n=1 Tax=Streptantibioticus silvisoli TaxID=2705255 RepID=A0ABT6W0C5_9ACTN|nr:ATP-binding cassette domain-containing protein [Streptantibioticus silvisoli]MDI5964186.1 ATP-binding cassette domain-containing protein [Streptantibioticus silvisoli]
MRLHGVGRRYGLRGRWVLRDIDLDVPRHALLRIDGRNGTGKSTLLRLLAGIDAPTAGRITGRPATAYVPERFAAALPFDAAGYLVHCGRIHGLPGPLAQRRAAQWLERFGIGEHARTPLEVLSKGTAQKVAVAQALLAEPELLILDEAWTGLDTAARAQLDAEVTARVAAGTTTVFVDHDPARLAGAATAVHRVEGAALVAVTPAAATAPNTAPAAVLIDAHRPGGPRTVPPALPASARTLPARPGDAGLRVTVAAADSDAVLRALLAADPAWHIRSVAPAPGPAPGGALAKEDGR